MQMRVSAKDKGDITDILGQPSLLSLSFSVEFTKMGLVISEDPTSYLRLLSVPNTHPPKISTERSPGS